MLRFESVLIAEILLKRLSRYSQTGEDADLLITYGDLANEMNIGINPRNLDHPLGDLSDYCVHECSLPKLSAIVVNKDEYIPGDGYFKYFYSGISREHWEQLFLAELTLIKEEKNWNLLAEKLHINLN